MSIEAALKNLDNPIENFDEDLLQRRGFVENLCRILSSASPNESTVFALYGEWGAGKTSVKNLLKKEVNRMPETGPVCVEFNPWAFSGQDQVLEAFFLEVGKAIGEKSDGKKAEEGFKKMGAYLSFGAKSAKTIHLGLDFFGVPGAKVLGLIGESLEGASKNAKDSAEQIDTLSKTSLKKVQKDLKDALVELGRPLLILIDDLDRLTPDQLLLVFQIVRLNASFPGVNYLLLMDKESVQRHLTTKQLGPEYLEKIVQFDFSLPRTTASERKLLLQEGLKHVMGPYAGRINWERWEEAWINGLQNIFTTVRRLKRFLHTLKFHVQFFANEDVFEVDPVDLFLVETLRKFAPGVHSEIPRILSDSIVQRQRLSRALWAVTKDDEEKFGNIELEQLIKSAPTDLKREVEHILKIMFPQIGSSNPFEDREEWIRDARICHELFFDSYFRLAIPRQLPTQKEIQDVFTSLPDRSLLRSTLSVIYDKVGLRNLLVRIQCHHEQVKPEFLTNLLTELWHLDERDAHEHGMARDWNSRHAVQSLSRFFLTAICPKDDRAKIVLEAMHGSGQALTLALFVNNDTKELQRNPHSTEVTFDVSELKVLREAVIRQIKENAASGSLLDSPDSGLVLFLWIELEGPEPVRSWLTAQFGDPKRIPQILSRLLVKTTVNDHRGKREYYTISRGNLEALFALNDEFENAIKALDSSKLGHWEKLALEQVQKRIEEKKLGKEEARYEE